MQKKSEQKTEYQSSSRTLITMRLILTFSEEPTCPDTMKLPTRKIRSLVQYSSIFCALFLVIYTFNSFHSRDLPTERFVLLRITKISVPISFNPCMICTVIREYVLQKMRQLFNVKYRYISILATFTLVTR